MEHKELVAVVAKAWAFLDAKMIEPFLSKDFEYESVWVFETMKGKANYMDYLTRIFQAIGQSGNVVAVKTLFQDRINQDVVMLGQGDSEAALQIWTEEGVITKMWMRPIDLLPR